MSSTKQPHDLVRRYRVNRSEINSWLWMARHALRKENERRAYEAMLTALWLMAGERPQ